METAEQAERRERAVAEHNARIKAKERTPAPTFATATLGAAASALWLYTIIGVVLLVIFGISLQD